MERNLVKIEELEQANERLLQLVEAGQPRQCTVLGLLAYELKILREEDVIQHLVETDGLGVVDLRRYDVPEEFTKTLDIPICWATWTVPIDQVDGFHFVASAYYPSAAVRSHWEKTLGGPILWFASTLDGIADHLEKFETAAAAFPAAPVAP